MSILTLTLDGNVNQKPLRRFEREGKVELYAINMEGMLIDKKIVRKDMPLGVFDSPHATFGNCVISSSNSNWSEILAVMTKDNLGDAHQIEAHIRSGRDIFVTNDKDLLSRRELLQEKFGVKICTGQEIEELFAD